MKHNSIKKKKLRILAVADEIHKPLYDYFVKDRWKDIDLIISCGDLPANYLSFLVTMISVPLLYVPGNHDTTYCTSSPDGCDNIDGKVIAVRGAVVGGLGGCMWYGGIDNQYTEKQMSRRVNKLLRKLRKFKRLDIFVAHAPPRGIHDLSDQCHRGFESFNKIIEKIHPAVIVHGHNHEIYRKEDREIVVSGVRVINACGYYVFDFELDQDRGKNGMARR